MGDCALFSSNQGEGVLGLLASFSPELAAVSMVVLILFLASLIAMAPLHKLRLPFTVAVMLVGFGFGVLLNTMSAGEHGAQHGGVVHLLSTIQLSPQLIFFVFLPPIVFESAFNLDARELLKNLVPICVLAVPVLIFSTAITGGAVMFAGGADHGLTWSAALLFGALISATDPVAVVALFKDLGAPKRLGILVEGESLFNDGTAIVLFNILLASVVISVAPLATAGGQVGHFTGAGQADKVQVSLQLKKDGETWRVEETRVAADEEAAAAAQRHVALVKAGKRQEAHAASSAAFKQETDLARFEAFVAGQKALYQSEQVELTKREVEGERALVAGVAKDTHGAETKVAFALARVDGKWLVDGVKLGQAQPAGTVGQQVLSGTGKFFLVAFGGIAVGLFLAWFIFMLIGKVISNEAVEISLSVVLAYASFIVAEHFLHVSGVMATVAAGLAAGSYGKTKVSPSVEHFMHNFWHYMSFAMNSLIFFFVGLVIVRSIAPEKALAALPLLGVTLAAVIVARAIGVFGTVPLLRRFVETITIKYQAVMWWGGLRGAVSLALALTVFTDTRLPQALRDTVLILSAGIVLFTLLVNALTMLPLIKGLELDKPSPVDRFAGAYAEHERVAVVAKVVDRLEREGAVLPSVLDDLRDRLRKRKEDATQALKTLSREIGADAEDSAAVAARVALSVEKREVANRFAQGELTEGATKLLLSSADDLLDLVKVGAQLPETRTFKLSGAIESRLLPLLEPLPLLGAVARSFQAKRLSQDVEATRGLYLATRSVERTLAEIEEGHAIPAQALAKVQARYSIWKYKAQERLNRLAAEFPEYARSSQGLLAEMQALRAEAHALHHLAEAGLLTDKSLGQARLDLVERERDLRAAHATGLELDPFTLLRAVPAFSEVPDAVVEALAGKLISRTFLEGQDVVTEGEPGSSMFLIARGCVGVYTTDDDGQEVLLSYLDHGSFFGELAALLGGTRNATVRAVTPVNLLELPRAVLVEELAKNEELDQEVRASIYPRAIGRALVDCAGLAPLNADQRNGLCLKFVEEQHEAGAVVAKRGEPQRLSYVSDGAVKLGERLVADGSVFGEGALTAATFEQDVVAESELTLLVLPAPDAERFRGQNPATVDACAKRLQPDEPAGDGE